MTFFDAGMIVVTNKPPKSQPGVQKLAPLRLSDAIEGSLKGLRKAFFNEIKLVQDAEGSLIGSKR